MARIVLGDHHILFLDALASVLSDHGHETGTVTGSTSEMVARVGGEQPGLCVIDRHGTAEGDDGRTIQVIGQVVAAASSTRVIVIGADAACEAARRALAAGASGYLHQSQGIGVLIHAVERVLRGKVVTAIPQRALSPHSAQPDLALRRAADLTGRERQCLMMLVDGLDTVAITRELDVSRTTARTHLQSVLTKLGVHSRLEAVSFAVRHRLPDLWPDASLPDPEPAPPAQRALVPLQYHPADSDQRLTTRLTTEFLRGSVAGGWLTRDSSRPAALAAGRRCWPAGAWQA